MSSRSKKSDRVVVNRTEHITSSMATRKQFQESFVAPMETSVDLASRIRSMEADRQVIADGVVRGPLEMMSDHRSIVNRPDAVADNLLQWQQHTTMLAKVFFHPKNIENIQNAIRRAVFDRSDGKFLISKQHDMELIVIMRSMYLQFARHEDDDITGQVEELNELILKEVLPNIMRNIEGHLAFAGSLHQLPAPMELPRATQARGDKLYGKAAGSAQDISHLMNTGTVGGAFL